MNPTYNTPKPSKKRPKLFNIDWRDLLHGLFLAFTTGTLTALSDAIGLIQSSGNISAVYEMFTPAHIKIHIGAGVLGALGYIVKKFSTNSEGKLLVKEDN